MREKEIEKEGERDRREEHRNERRRGQKHRNPKEGGGIITTEGQIELQRDGISVEGLRENKES